MSEGTGNGNRVERAAHSAMLGLIARAMILIGIPVTLAVIGWGGREIVGATQQNTLALVEIKGIIAGVQSRIDGTATLLNSRIDVHGEQLKSLREVDQRHDSKLDDLQKQLYQPRPR